MKRFTFAQWLSSSLSSSRRFYARCCRRSRQKARRSWASCRTSARYRHSRRGVETSPARAVAANSAAEATSPSAPRRRSVEFRSIDEARLGALRATAAALVFPDATSLISAIFNIPPFGFELIAGCLPGSRAGSSLLEPDVGPRDRRAGTVILPASRPMFVPPRDFDSPSSVARPAPLGRFGRRAGLGSGRPSPGKSANDQAILPPSGSAVRRRHDSSGGARSAHRFCQARATAETRTPSRPFYCRPAAVTRRRPCAAW